MGQVRHASATARQSVRPAIQRSQASLARPSRERGLNPKAVAKWQKLAKAEAKEAKENKEPKEAE